MRLKKLELFGFKSFADKTLVLFDEGVTCVVGPNGCGKSNISDAIRWVLGERSAKLLRGTKMDDLIFNGTEFRKPLAFAEVSLTIDNADRGLPIEYNEVTLTRRLYRTGVSEYEINRTACRLKDVEDLILNTGIGSSSYSMIEQGRIDYILNADADERRFLIEEAAGISKYKVKKEEAIRKLERTEENLLRLRDIVSEVQKNIQYAERQARRAERYKAQFERLKDLEIKKAFYDLGQTESVQSGLAAETAAFAARKEGLSASAEMSRQELQRAQGLMQEILRRCSREESRGYELRSQMEQIEQQIRFNAEKRLEMATRRGEIQQETAHLRDRIEASEAELAAKQLELSGFESQKESLGTQLRQAEEELAAIEERMAAIRELLEKAKAECFQASYDASKMRNEYHRLVALIESNRERQRKQAESESRFRDERELLDHKITQTQEQSADLTAKLAAVEAGRHTASRSLEEAENLRETLRASRDAIERTVRDQEARLSMLLELDAGAGTTPEQVLQAMDPAQAALFRHVRDVVTVRDGYECALEAVLEAYVRAWVAEDVSAAAELSRCLLEKQALPAGILIRGEVTHASAVVFEPPNHPLVECALKEAVTVQSGYESVLRPFIENVYVLKAFPLEDMEIIAQAHPALCFVTREGSMIEPSGRLFLRQGKNTAEQNFLRRGIEISGLRKTIADAKTDLARAETELRGIETTRLSSDLEYEQLEAQTVDLRILHESLEAARRSLLERREAVERELELLAADAAEMSEEAAKAGEQEIMCRQRLKSAEDLEAKIRADQEALVRDLDAADHQRTGALQRSLEKRAAFDHLAERYSLLERALTLMVSHRDEAAQRIAMLSDELSRIADKETGLDADDTALADRRTDNAAAVRESEVRLELIRHERAGAEEEIAQCQGRLQQLLDEVNGLQNQMHELEMKTMDVGYQQRNIRERVQQLYRIQLSDLDHERYVLAPQDLAEVETEISELREKVEALGTVNLLAIEEYDELKQRYDFLNAQQRDLESARESLMEAIRKINRTTKTLFEETFLNVQKTFQEYYEVLFRGGQARLVLTDETNPLESGIDIVVRPPGKRLQHISLLSGGEKALTAIALLFALMKIKPSPFCVLDEVDAPLDEANIDRFLTVLRTFLDRVQFIIVTHNRKTVMMGDSLYGVTMEDAGVSKLVSVKVNPDDTAGLPYQFAGDKAPQPDVAKA